MKKQVLIISAAILLSSPMHAQTRENVPADTWSIDTLMQPIPVGRQLAIEKIHDVLRKLDARDGAVDSFIYYEDSVRSEQVSRAVFGKSQQLWINIENLNTDNNTKLFYLRSLERILIKFKDKNWVNVEASYFKNVLENFRGFMKAEQSKSVMDFAKANSNMYMYDNEFLLNNYPEAKAQLYSVIGAQHPDIFIKNLADYANEPYADPIIAAAAKTQPGTILNYALSNGKMSAAVRRNTDPLVKTIIRIADESKSPLKALPFLSEIHSGDKTVAQVDAVAGDDVNYFKSLVALKLKNDPFARRYLDDEIQYRSLKFVRIINELHNSGDAVRFKSIQPFNAEELYYICIGGQDEIYTSSFINGTFRRMMSEMKPMPGNEFMEKVHYDRFRTFLRMCAGFNTLQDFLSTFDENEKNSLMRKFVANLEQGDEYDLEDAVDVADAFGSITDSSLLVFLKQEVKDNYDRCYQARNAQSKKGVIVYGLLGAIFAGDKGKDNQELPIPPISYVPYNDLVNSNNGVVEQVFFYGDKDGMGAYNNFLNQHRNGRWKITTNKQWATITSTGEHKMSIYVNIPLPEEQGLDDQAQKALAAYLDENDIQPTILIHRGHSYYLPTTLEYLQPSVKVVMLGSCGGYHNLANVLDRAPDAHIISSKQVGALRVNVPIINEINDYASSGKDMDWIAMWKDLTRRFNSSGAYAKDLFTDYVPPNKNLGAIFIKAYRRIIDEGLMN